MMLQQENIHFTRTRLAPTPSGFLHLGNILSFVITVSLARKYGARILLRIDDLDHERAQDEYVQDIFDTLLFLGIPWDEGPADITEFNDRHSQLHRMHLYEELLLQLQEKKKVFACTCSRSRVLRDSDNGTYPGTCIHKNYSLDMPGASWRLHTDEHVPLFVQLPGSGPVEGVLPASMHCFVVRKKDAYPSYQLASLADDLHFGVDLVVRGLDLWPSTLAQHYLAYQLGADLFQRTAFFHHALLTGTGGEKLSKSAGATSVHYLRDQGYSASAIYTRIASMLGASRTIHSWEELAELLDQK